MRARKRNWENEAYKELSKSGRSLFLSSQRTEKATKREKFRFSTGKDNNEDAEGNEDGVLNKINSNRIWWAANLLGHWGVLAMGWPGMDWPKASSPPQSLLCWLIFLPHFLLSIWFGLFFVFFIPCFAFAFKSRCHINFTSYKSRKIFYCRPNLVHILLPTPWHINCLNLKRLGLRCSL